MPDDKREPQSYGSQEDWVTGRTGQQVQNPKSEPPAEHADFYDGRRDAESSSPDQGGKTSDVQLADSTGTEGSVEDDRGHVGSVTGEASGARRDSYFKKRDYE